MNEEDLLLLAEGAAAAGTAGSALVASPRRAPSVPTEGMINGAQPAFNERLIQEVKKHPSLYNHSKRSFTDTVERSKIWDEVAAAIDPNVSGEFAKKRWLQLRDRYRKELKVAIRQNFSVPMRWCYFNHLSWLDPYLKDNLSLATPNFTTNDEFSLLDSLIKTETDDGFDESEDITVNSGLSALQSVLASTEPAVTNGGHDASVLDGEASGSPDSVLTSRSEDVDVIVQHSSTNNDDNESGRHKTTEVKDETFRFLPRHLLGVASASSPNRPQAASQSANTNGQSSTNNIAKQLLHANRVLVDWVNDEDMLYARIIGLRLKKLEPKRRKRIRTRILELLDASDDDDETPTKTAKMEISA